MVPTGKARAGHLLPNKRLQQQKPQIRSVSAFQTAVRRARSYALQLMESVTLSQRLGSLWRCPTASNRGAQEWLAAT